MNKEIREVIEKLLNEVYDAESFMELFENYDEEHMRRVHDKRDVIKKAEELLAKYDKENSK